MIGFLILFLHVLGFGNGKPRSDDAGRRLTTFRSAGESDHSRLGGSFGRAVGANAATRAAPGERLSQIACGMSDPK